MNTNAAAGGAALLIVIAILVGTVGSQVYKMNAEPEELRLTYQAKCASCEWADELTIGTPPVACPSCGAKAAWPAMICTNEACGRLTPADPALGMFETDDVPVCSHCKQGVLRAIPPVTPDATE